MKEQLRIGNYFNPISRSHNIHLPMESVILKVCSIGITGVKSLLIDEVEVGPVKYKFVNYSNISFIPLTNMWLFKFGFKREIICIMSDIARAWHENQHKGSSLDESFHLGEYYIVPRIGMRLMNKAINSNLLSDFSETGNDIQYVHQLQNLFFAITGNDIIYMKLK